MSARKITWRHVKHMQGNNVLDTFSTAGFAIPADYISCITKNNGARPDHNVMVVEGIETEFRRLLRVDADQEGNVQEAYDAISDKFPNAIPFGDDSYGNFVCFCWGEDKSHVPNICFLDKERDTMIPLADSFTLFLEMLQSEEE